MESLGLVPVEIEVRIQSFLSLAYTNTYLEGTLRVQSPLLANGTFSYQPALLC